MTGQPCPPDDLASSDRAFVVLPFHHPYLDCYTFGIKVGAQEAGWECVNGQESYFASGEYIICNICQETKQATVVIAELTEENPNVYYEFGLACGLGTDCVALRRKTLDGPPPSRSLQAFLRAIGCLEIEYSSIQHLQSQIASALAKVSPNPVKEVKPPELSGQCGVIAILPDESDDDPSPTTARASPAQPNGIAFGDVWNFGIRESLARLYASPPDLTTLNTDADGVQRLAIEPGKEQAGRAPDKLVRAIAEARYCIIDITTGHPEVYFWLGFIHGLDVNPHVQIREDLSYIYISQSKPEAVPFDVSAVRVDQYQSVKNLAGSLREEIRRREMERLHRYNKAKHDFWKPFTFHNTAFFLGAIDVYNYREKDCRSKVSIQDYRTFNTLTYLLLLLGREQPFEYDVQEVHVADYLKWKDLEGVEHCGPKVPGVKNEQPTRLPRSDDQTQDLDAKPECLRHLVEGQSNSVEGNSRSGRHARKNLVLVGSSCANPASEMLLRHLYGNLEDKQGYEFKTRNRYKSRSSFWTLVTQEEGTLETQQLEALGIYATWDGYVSSAGYQKGKCAGFGEDDTVREGARSDAGLLIVTNDWPDWLYQAGAPPDERIIVLSGFRKYATLLLAGIMARYFKAEDGRTSGHEPNPSPLANEISVWSPLSQDRCHTGLTGSPQMAQHNHLLEVLNERIATAAQEERRYCLEAVLEFRRPDGGKESRWQSTLMGFFDYRRISANREDMSEAVIKKSEDHRNAEQRGQCRPVA